MHRNEDKAQFGKGSSGELTLEGRVTTTQHFYVKTPQTPSKEKWATAEERPYSFQKILQFCISLILFIIVTEHNTYELVL